MDMEPTRAAMQEEPDIARRAAGSPAPRIAVIAGNPPLVRASRALGVETVFVHDVDEDRPAVAEDADIVVAAPLADTEALTAALLPLHRERPLQRVLSLTERGLFPAARVADGLGVPGNTLRSVTLLHDKRRMRDLLNARGIGPVPVAAPRSVEELAAFCQDAGTPVVLKPATGAASKAVFLVDSPAEAASAWASFHEAGGTEPIAEGFLDGPEISVEAFSVAGRHTILALTDKIVGPQFIETGHDLPSNLPEDVRAEVTRLVVAFLDAVGLVEGPTHTEVKLTRAGPRIVESHNRVGGDKIRDLLHRALGLKVVDLTVGCPLGLLPPPARTPTARRGASIRYLTPPPGTVRGIEVPEDRDPTAVVDLQVAVGDVVGPVRSSYDRAGYVLVDGPDTIAAARACEDLARRVLITTSP